MINERLIEQSHHKIELFNKSICGIDEAGRGPIAGPLVVCGVVLKEYISGIDDSKKISPKKRKELFAKIIKSSIYHIVTIDSIFIDNFGISQAIKLSLEEIKSFFSNYNIIFDGNSTFGVSNISYLVKGDQKIAQIAAASILAKVYRDALMQEYDKLYPIYDFKNNKGYGTKKHREIIKINGLSPIHRKSFCKNIIEPNLFS
ncbi:MAG: ribonuclease HII [Epsilonproteobacteria bacterium]|nr:ribonuclease HII [Campylobacterota bacterium]